MPFNRRLSKPLKQLSETYSQYEIEKLLLDLSPESSNDPRWVEMFLDTMINGNNASDILDSDEYGMDDLLFFVKQISNTADNMSERVFVKRKTGNAVPGLDDLIAWRETFFLNCLVQMTFDMTVAVCEKRNVPIDFEDFPLNSARQVAGIADDSTAPHKKAMVPVKHVTKRVYASPHKARMDKKTGDSEISYPTMYFCVNDFEDAFEETVILPGQYLCVELFCDIPIGGDDNVHVTLFQGAVPFQSLFDTYQAKQTQQAVGNPFRALNRITRNITASLFSPSPSISLSPRSTTSSNSNSLHNGSNQPNLPSIIGGKSKRFGLEDDDRQYVSMRGPNGKGHAQVAIKPASTVLKPVALEQSIATVSVEETFIDKEKQSEDGVIDSPLVESFRRLSTNVVASFKTPDEQEIVLENGLACFLTFIHLSWQSIVSDIINRIRIKTTKDIDSDTTRSASTPTHQ